MVVISIAFVGLSEWRTGERGYQVSTALLPISAKTVVPVVVNGTGLRIAMQVNLPGASELSVNQSRNESFIKIRFRHDIIRNGDNIGKQKIELGSEPCLVNREMNVVKIIL